MVKFISFPINEYNQYLSAIDHYDEQEYEEALILFKELKNIPYFKKMIMDYLIDTYIRLNEFDSVYEMIENEFLEELFDEDYLIEKYIYTMLLERKYNEASNLIQLMEGSHSLSKNLKKSLSKLKRLSNELISNEEVKKKVNLDAYKKQHDLIDFVLHLDDLNYDKEFEIIHDVLSDALADPLIKYQIIKQLAKCKPDLVVRYTNALNETYDVDLSQFHDFHEDEYYKTPPNLVYTQLCKHQKGFIINLELIENIWLNDYLKFFPKKIDNISYLAYLLHLKILYLFGIKYEENEVKKLYKTDNITVYENLSSNILQFTNLCYNK